jgi:hypothetical protein
VFCFFFFSSCPGPRPRITGPLPGELRLVARPTVAHTGLGAYLPFKQLALKTEARREARLGSVSLLHALRLGVGEQFPGDAARFGAAALIRTIAEMLNGWFGSLHRPGVAYAARTRVPVHMHTR